jgi:hypothetical protein
MPYSRIKGHAATLCNTNVYVVLKEKRSQYKIDNPNRKLVCRTPIDGGYIPLNSTCCCDYLVVNCPDCKAYLVELKGCDVLHALEQINATLTLLKSDLSGHACFARIVPTRVGVPNLQNNQKFLDVRKALRKLGGDLKIRAIMMTEAF